MTNKIIYSLESKSLRYFYDDNSERIIKETDKSRVFECIKKGTAQDDEAPMIIKTKKDNRCSHCVKVREDGSYTVYLNRDGQPLVFTPKGVKGRTNI